MSLGEALPTDRRPLSSELHVPTAPAAPPSRRGWACVCPVALCLRTPPPLPHPLVPEKAARGSPRLLLVRGLRLTGDVVPGCERLALGTSQAFVTALQRVRSWPCSRDPRMAGPVHCRHRRVGRGRSLPSPRLVPPPPRLCSSQEPGAACFRAPPGVAPFILTLGEAVGAS